MPDFLYPDIKEFNCSCCKFDYTLEDRSDAFCHDCWVHCFAYEYEFCVVSHDKNLPGNQQYFLCEHIREPVASEKSATSDEFEQKRLI